MMCRLANFEDKGVLFILRKIETRTREYNTPAQLLRISLLSFFVRREKYELSQIIPISLSTCRIPFLLSTTAAQNVSNSL